MIKIEPFYDEATHTLSYVVFDPISKDAVVIDPVLDYEPLASSISTDSVEKVADFVRKESLRLHYVLETHAHADHLSGSQILRRRFGARVGIGAHIQDVQKVFKDVFDLDEAAFPVDGSQFDRLFDDGEKIRAGSLEIEVIATPGHTPACVSYRIEDAVFTGDALFIEDYGTGRCDFPSGSADALFTSVHDRLYALPDATRVFVGHDYQPKGRPLRFETTIEKSKETNVQLRASTTREDFVRMRQARDATLAPPRLLYPSVQINIDAGRLPKPRVNGRRYLSIPLKNKNGESYLYRDVDPHTVARWLHQVHVVDVREPDEFTGELGHISGAELVPLSELEASAKSWREDDAIVLVCRSGARSARAAALLASLEFRNVMNMAGGMVAWNDVGLPTAR